MRAALASRRSQNVRYVFVSNPTLTRAEFFESLANGFGLSPEAATSKTRFLIELQRTATERHAVGGITTLIVDEAQSLSLELLEEVRLLANIETASEKLMPVILVGQPELAERLNQPSHRQLKQRIALRCYLPPLDVRETAGYITSRLQKAGAGTKEIFSQEAVKLIHARSRGIPRLISVICDNALVNGFAANMKVIDDTIIREVCEDFDLQPADDECPAAAKAPVAPIPFVNVLAAKASATSGNGSADAGVNGHAHAVALSDGPVMSGIELFTHFTRRRRFSLL